MFCQYHYALDITILQFIKNIRMPYLLTFSLNVASLWNIYFSNIFLKDTILPIDICFYFVQIFLKHHLRKSFYINHTVCPPSNFYQKAIFFIVLICMQYIIYCLCIWDLFLSTKICAPLQCGFDHYYTPYHQKLDQHLKHSGH